MLLSPRLRPCSLAALLLALLFFVLLGTASAAPPEGSEPSYALRIRLHPDTARLDGLARLDPAGTMLTRLQLAPSAQVHAVRSPAGPVPFQLEAGELRLALNEPVAWLEIDYSAVFDDPVPDRPLHAEDPSYGVSATITPQGAFLGSGSGWYPLPSPTPARYRVSVSAPAGLVAVTAGRLMALDEADGETRSVWETASPLPPLSLSAGRWELQTDLTAAPPIYTLFTAANRELAPAYLAAARQELDAYQQLFGPYPYEKFAIVENFLPTGYGFPSWTLLGSRVIRLPFILDTSLGHEIAHSWWGTGVRAAPSGGNWAEGLTTYLADHLQQERISTDAARAYRLKQLRDYASLVDAGNDMPLTGFTHRHDKASQAIGYGKAMMVFHLLRIRLGEAAFWSGLRSLAARRMGESLSWRQFLAELVPPGAFDLERFQAEWLERSGAPQLALESVTAVAEADGWRIDGVIRQTGAGYALPVDLQLHSGTGTVLRQRLEVEAERTPFRLHSSEMPRRLELDPEVNLFRRLEHTERPPIVNDLRGARRLLVVSGADLPQATRNQALLLLEGLRLRGAPLLAETELSAAQLREYDLLVLGRPRRPELTTLLPAELTLQPGRFMLEGQTFATPDAALFAALPHPAGNGRSATLFWPLSGEAARQAARKIPHYGKYSYLVFSAGENRLKGTWPVHRSPLVHQFSNRESAP